jgi:hypothetical protein
MSRMQRSEGARLEREIVDLPVVESIGAALFLSFVHADGSRVVVLVCLAEAVAVAGGLIEAARLCIGPTGWSADVLAFDGSDLRCR